MANEVYQLKVNGKGVKLGKGPNAEDEFTSFKDLKTSMAKTMSLPDAIHLSRVKQSEDVKWQLKVARPETVRVFLLRQRMRHHSNRYFYTGYEAAHSATKGGSITGIQLNNSRSLEALLMQLFPITIDGDLELNSGLLTANYTYDEESSIVYHSMGEDQKLIFGIPPWVKQSLTRVHEEKSATLVIYIKFCSNFKPLYNQFQNVSNGAYKGTVLYDGVFNKTGLKVTFTKDLITIETYGLSI